MSDNIKGSWVGIKEKIKEVLKEMVIETDKSILKGDSK